MIDWKGVAQPALARAGLYRGKIDGDDGPKTYAALIDLVGSPCQPVADGLARYFHEYGLTSPGRLAEFIAQIANETGGFTRWEEDLRYRASAMLSQWPSHFTAAQAAAAVGKPIEIASRAYGGRNGNAPYPSQDGYRYRGRGALQLTGRANYDRFGLLLGLPLTERPELAAEPYNSTRIALEFWKEGKVNEAVDDGDFAGARRITNVGNRFARDKKGKLVVPIGLDHVAELRAKLLGVLS